MKRVAIFVIGFVILIGNTCLVYSAETSEPTPVTTWQWTLDLTDIGFNGVVNQRHTRPSYSNENASYTEPLRLCCLDVAWTPIDFQRTDFRWGGSVNTGYWGEALPEQGNGWLETVNITTQATLLWHGEQGLWARADVGPAFLLLRQKLGKSMVFGYGGGVRTGYTWRLSRGNIFAGVGTRLQDFVGIQWSNTPGLDFFTGVAL